MQVGVAKNRAKPPMKLAKGAKANCFDSAKGTWFWS